MLEVATEPMLGARSCLRQALADLERRVRKRAQDDPVCRRLMSIPGARAVVAPTCRAAVDDPSRFSAPSKIGPWVGLTPSRGRSGERDVAGAITKAGEAHLRRALCQVAMAMMRPDNGLHGCGQRADHGLKHAPGASGEKGRVTISYVPKAGKAPLRRLIVCAPDRLT